MFLFYFQNSQISTHRQAERDKKLTPNTSGERAFFQPHRRVRAHRTLDNSQGIRDDQLELEGTFKLGQNRDRIRNFSTSVKECV